MRSPSARRFTAARGTDPSDEEGGKALAQVDRLMAVMTALHQSGFQLLVPTFSFGTWRNGPNLRYEGLRGGDGVDETSRKALSDFFRSETARADGLRSVVFDRNRALLQAAIGKRLAQFTQTLDTVRGKATLDLEALASSQPPGELRDLLLNLEAYGRIAALPGATSGSVANTSYQ
jgi:hypothetical protein